MSWIVSETAFRSDASVANGNKYMIGNGYIGIRGTLEEHGRSELAGCTLAGLYDRVGAAWREPVNAPHAFLLRISEDGAPLGVLTAPIERHVQGIDLRSGLHFRETTFSRPHGGTVTLRCERFLSLADPHLGALRCSLRATVACRLTIETGIEGDVWDLNGPHLEHFRGSCDDGVLLLECRTHELGAAVAVAEAIVDGADGQRFDLSGNRILRRLTVGVGPEVAWDFTKVVAVFTALDNVPNPAASAVAAVRAAANTGYGPVLARSRAVWDERWAASDVRIGGDPDAQLALRYSIYQLLILAPTHSDRVSIPARGLSGQVYKGAVFWDTEIFMLPFFDHALPAVARNLLRYRYHTLDGARRKAAEYGFRGAFYAWESQETGDDACTLFNIDDVFTGRPMRTYFRDKQIHISGDVAFAIWRHFKMTGDTSLLIEGGAEIILECARFFYSYAWLKPERDRFELIDVDGPDEYHERVDNNAFTSALARETLGIALRLVDLLAASYPKFYHTLIDRLDFAPDIPRLRDLHARLFVPAPDPNTLVIEQFSGYHRLEDVTLEELKWRVLQPTEYLGGGNGLATSTKILKQADVVLMLHLFGADQPKAVKRANWHYYEPRTEHGSSLSACVYALLAAEIGDVEWAYRYFLRTATIDLVGGGKQYVGSLYIGGTHPAANGGAWMAAVLGFGGLQLRDDHLSLAPRLPRHWHSLTFRVRFRGQGFEARITPDGISVSADATNSEAGLFDLGTGVTPCEPGCSLFAPGYFIPSDVTATR
jgi:nigerose phosphorylase